MLRVQRRRRGIVTQSFESRCRVVLTVIWISITLLIAMFVPDMGEVISVIGGISAFFIFIFPGMKTSATCVFGCVCVSHSCVTFMSMDLYLYNYICSLVISLSVNYKHLGLQLMSIFIIN